MKSKQNTQTDDTQAYKKWGRGDALTYFEELCVFDDNSIENPPKQARENLELIAELNEYFKEKKEKEKALIIDLKLQIYDYMVWQQTRDAEAFAATVRAQQNSMADSYRRDEDRLMKESPTGWIENLLKNLFPQKEQDYYRSFLESSIKEASEDKKSTITNVLKLAACHGHIREFIFENPEKHDKKQHCQLIMQRIFCVGEALNDTRSNEMIQRHILMKIAEKKQQAEPDTSNTRKLR